jgi:hypothetical protein
MSSKETDSYVQGTDYRNISAREAHALQIAPEINTMESVSTTEYSAASGAHVIVDNGRMMKIEMPDAARINAEADLRKQETIAGAMRDRDLFLRTLTPTEVRIEIEREYIPELKRLYAAVYDAKNAIDEYQDDEQQFITRGMIEDVYVRMSSPEYRRVHCHGSLHYNNTILKDVDLMQNYYEIKRSSVSALPGATSYEIWYLPRGTTQKDLEADSLARAKLAYSSGKPLLINLFNKAYKDAAVKSKELQDALASIESADNVISRFKQFKPLKDEVTKLTSS